MANKVTTIKTGNSTTVLNRLGPDPLDQSSLHLSYSNALNYATTSPKAYFGQVIVVNGDVSQNKDGIYLIYNAGTDANPKVVLKKILDKDTIEVLISNLQGGYNGTLEDLYKLIASGVGDAGYRGSFADMATIANLKRGMTFNVLASEVTAANAKYSPIANDIEAGDWIIVKQDVTYTSSSSSDIGTWEKNLSGAITVANILIESGSTLDNETDKYISGILKNGNDITFRKTKLPVTGVNTNNLDLSSNTTQAIVGLTIDSNGKIKPTVKNIEYAVTRLKTEVFKGKDIIVDEYVYVTLTADGQGRVGYNLIEGDDDKLMVMLNGLQLEPTTDYTLKIEEEKYMVIFTEHLVDQDDVVMVTYVAP